MTGKNFPYKTWVITGLEYLLALLTTALTTGGLFLVRENISPTIISLVYLLPVGLSTALWGLGPGVVTALTSFLALNYFFIQPYYSLAVHHTQDLLGLFVFLIISIVISQLVGRVRNSLSQAVAREHEAIRLYELSTRLVGLHDEKEISQTLAEQIMTALGARRVDVVIEGRSDMQPLHISQYDNLLAEQAGEDSPQPSPVLVPLQSARGFLGEIQVWRDPASMLESEERLLQTFASQGVLALERARLGEADRRARISEESDRFKSSLLSSVSHELRTPLATIKASVTSLRSGMIDWESESRSDLLAAIDEETDHLNQLVGNLLNMARIEAGALKPQRSWNSLSEISASALNRTRQQSQQHRLEMDIPEDLPLIPVDYLLIEQVLINLISNSVKYSPEDTTIHLQARQADDRTLEVIVSNQGPPVPPEYLEHIFDKFHRFTATDKVTGAGLGLSICKGIVEAHDGRIWAVNLPDGFAIHFSLPLSAKGFPAAARPRTLDE